MCVWICEVTLSAVAGRHRFDLGFYAGRGFGLVASGLLLVARWNESIITAATRGASLTQQLLTFARRQANRPETVNPNRLLVEFEPLLRQAAGSQIQIALNFDTLVYPVAVDPAQFQSAILNLVDESGGGRPACNRTTHFSTQMCASAKLPLWDLPKACLPRSHRIPAALNFSASYFPDRTAACSRRRILRQDTIRQSTRPAVPGPPDNRPKEDTRARCSFRSSVRRRWKS